MSISQQQAKDLLKELSCKKGGSLLGKVDKHVLNDNSRILFIGLGGAGCTTINRIKGIYETKFRHFGNVKFMCVDTDETDITKLKIEKGGYISNDEIFEIYDSSASQLLINRPEITRDWLSEAVPRDVIDETGAKSRRVVGRVMLCGTGKYAALEGVIKDKISEFTNGGIIEVVICAGISGGTGSGTFIDVSYMVRMILNNINVNNQRSTQMYGIFYTPDVQQSIPDVGGVPSVWNTVQQNGYAAMKELSYFMNIGDSIDGDTVYSLRVVDPSGGIRECQKPIFDQGHAFIISATTNTNKFEEIVECTAEGILNMFRPGQEDANDETKHQSIMSTLCNIGRNIGTWATSCIGIPDGTKTPDPCGIKNTYFPAFMNYSFSSFGYRSVYLPKNEMAAYIANKAFSEIIKLYKRAFRFTDKDAFNIAQFIGISSAEEILRGVKTEKGYNEEFFRIAPNNPKYPQRFGMQIAGRMHGLDDTVKEAADVVDVAIQGITGLDVCIDSIVNRIISLLEGNELYIDESGNQFNLWKEFGPVGANIILAGTAESGNDTVRIHGIIDILKNIGKTLGNALAAANKNLEEKTTALKQARETLARDITPHDDEVEVFIGACASFSNAKFDVRFLEEYMVDFLTLLIKKLTAYSNETFEIYTPIIMQLADILNEDSEIFADYYLQNRGNSTVFSLNAFNLENASRNNDLFEKMFEGLVADPRTIDRIRNGLLTHLFGVDQRNNWRTYISSPDILCDQIRRVFSQYIDPIVREKLEKFIVLVYGNKEQIVRLIGGRENVTIQDLDTIWNDDTLRDNALQEAAKKIFASISDSAAISFNVWIEQTVASRFDRNIGIVLLNDTPNLNHAIMNVVAQDPALQNRCNITVTDSLQTEISVFECVRPFPLEMVRNMKEYATAYFRSENLTSNAAGRHLDEVSEKWQINLPEIYGKDTEDYYMGIHQQPANFVCIPDRERCMKDNKPFNNDVEVYKLIREMVDYGLANKYIDVSSNDKFVIYDLKNVQDAEAVEKLEDKTAEISENANKDDNNTDPFWKRALDALFENDNISRYDMIALDRAVKNDPLNSRQTNMPANKLELKNIYRIVRADMNMHKRVAELYKVYKETNLFDNLEKISSFKSSVEYYVKALKCGMISYDQKKGWLCTYSSNPNEPPIVFLDDYKQKNPGLDVPFENFIVFSAFVKNALSDTVKKETEARYNDLQQTCRQNGTSIQSCKADTLDQMQNGLASSLFTIRDPEEKEKAIGEQLGSSEYFELYNYPRKCKSKNDAKTLLKNLEGYLRILEGINRTGRL